MKFNAQLMLMRRLIVILGETLAHFSCGNANDGVGIEIIFRGTTKDLDADGAFLEFFCVAVHGFAYDVIEETGIATAVDKMGTILQTEELLFDHVARDRGFGLCICGHRPHCQVRGLGGTGLEHSVEDELAGALSFEDAIQRSEGSIPRPRLKISKYNLFNFSHLQAQGG